MTWLTVITTVISIVAAAVDYLKSRQAIDAATAEILSRNLKGALDEIAAANKARAAVRADALRNPDGVHDSDGFRRD